MYIQENISLKPFNTFGIDVNAKHYVSVTSIPQLKEVLKLKTYPRKLILGGGSNILLTKNQDTLVIHINIKGIHIVSQTENDVIIQAQAGENWHEFVLWALNNNYGGLENMSLIPGYVGTAPIQNIGAYGVELKDVFESCEAISIENGITKTFTKTDCQFGYRNSVFKQKEKGKYIITSVNFKLSKKNHKLLTQYGSITSQLETMNKTTTTIQDISKAVISIRESKLPNPKEIGNAGSFFKNPIVSKQVFNKLVSQFNDVPNYPITENEIKVPAGWLIEKAGFKGKRYNNHGVHNKQALVLVNYGGANGLDIFELSKLIQQTVNRLFSISIETEVNIL